MEKMPKLYQNKFDKAINNNKNMCVVEEEKNEDVISVLKNVYAGLGNKYNTKVIIETFNNVYDTSLIYKSKEMLITKENSIIPISQIKRITIKK